MFSSFLNFVISFFPKQKKISLSEAQKFKLMLFGKDVLSIIDSYYLEGFDEWTLHMKNINKEYLTSFRVDWHDRLREFGSNNTLFNFRTLDLPFGYWWHIYNYNPRTKRHTDTKIVLNKKKYL